jgi:hypothetical protein
MALGKKKNTESWHENKETSCAEPFAVVPLVIDFRAAQAALKNRGFVCTPI